MFLGYGFGFDSIMALAMAGAQTSRITLGTAVVPTWPRHPLVMAQQAATANAIAGGRFRLGIGPSHVPVMKMYGIDYDKPIRHMREYLTVLLGLLHDGKISHKGASYQVNGFLDVETPETPTPVLVSALHEQMCRLAGGLADGVLPWLATPAYVADVIVPQVRQGAKDAGRVEPPPVIAEIPCVLSTDVDKVRETVRAELGMYLYMPFYIDMMTRAGVPGAADAATSGWSDAMIDAVVPWGDEDRLAKAAQTYLDAGASEVVFSPFGGDHTTLEVLGAIARG